MAVRRTALVAGVLALAGLPARAAEPPTLDCALGYEGVTQMVRALPGAQTGRWQDFDVVGVAGPEPDTWRVEIAFTSPGHAAHPAIIARTLRKQVTGVWTAESKGCGFGNRSAFTDLMADMKAGDTELTNDSRKAVEREKRGQSPLDITP